MITPAIGIWCLIFTLCNATGVFRKDTEDRREIRRVIAQFLFVPIVLGAICWEWFNVIIPI